MPPELRQAVTDTIEAAPPPRSVEEVKAMLEGTEKGGVRNSIHNCLTVFQYDPILSGAVAKNLLTERIDLLKPIGRKRRTGSKAMTDTDMKYIRLYLEDTYGLTSEKKIADAADLAADANSYHPIRDYLNGLVWDGKERIRYCLRHFLGADTDNIPCGCSCWEPSTGHSAPAVSLRSCSVWLAVREPGNPPSSGCWP